MRQWAEYVGTSGLAGPETGAKTQGRKHPSPETSEKDGPTGKASVCR